MALDTPAWLTDITFIISLPVVSTPTLITSPAKKEVIPEVDIIISPLAKSAVRDDVTPVPTIGLWIILSIAINALVFWFLLIKLCDVPIPTAVISKGTAIDFNAFSADAASLTKLSLTLIINAEFGMWVKVAPRLTWPWTAGKKVAAIPIESVVAPTPVVVHPTIGCFIRYSTSSPVTKKWFGMLMVLFVTLIISVLDPSKSFLNIWLVSFNIGKPVLAPKKVPSYTSNLVWIDADWSSISAVLELSPTTLRAWINVLTSTALFAAGVNVISVKQSDPSLLPPIVPMSPTDAAPAPVATFPYSVMNTRVSSSTIMISENSYLSFVTSLTWTIAYAASNSSL